MHCISYLHENFTLCISTIVTADVYNMYRGRPTLINNPVRRQPYIYYVKSKTNISYQGVLYYFVYTCVFFFDHYIIHYYHNRRSRPRVEYQEGSKSIWYKLYMGVINFDLRGPHTMSNPNVFSKYYLHSYITKMWLQRRLAH